MLLARCGWFVVGTAAFYLMRPGIVPWWEAVERGLLVSLVAFLVEMTGKLVSSTRLKWLLCLAFAPLFALAVPLVAALHPLHTVPKRTPASFGLAFEDVRFRTADGLTLAGWVIPAENERGNVIFCHGHGRNRGHVAGLLPTLHDLGLNVLAFDFRGHGDSDGHVSTFGYREVTDLLAAEAYLRQRFPNKPLFLVGVSLGAAVSLQALPYLTDVRGVWSEGSFARFSEVAAHKFCWVPGVLRDNLMQLYYRVGWLDTGFWGPSANPIECVMNTSVPVYFCHAVKDELVPLAQGQALFDAHPGPKWNWWVADATHYDVRQRNHEEYLRRLRSFIEYLLSQETSAAHNEVAGSS
jgi:pimeloyl-ACP methyl ester carboxylesterase